MFSNRPFEKPYSEELIKAAKEGDIKTVRIILGVRGKHLVYDFDHVSHFLSFSGMDRFIKLHYIGQQRRTLPKLLKSLLNMEPM